MLKEVVSISDGLPYPEFAKCIGKTPEAVKGMINKGKLPVIPMKESPSSKRIEYWVYLPAWNEGLKLAFEALPIEMREGWLTWLGLGDR